MELRGSRRKGLYLMCKSTILKRRPFPEKQKKKITDKINIRVTSDIKQANTIEYIIIKLSGCKV